MVHMFLVEVDGALIERIAICNHKCTAGSQRYFSGAGQLIGAFRRTIVPVLEDDVDHSIFQ
jgi:hypothetical protein